MSQMDWFESEEKKFEDLPEGFYTAALTNVTLDETKEEPRLSIEFTLSTRRKVWLNLRFSEKQKKFANWQFRVLDVYDHAKDLVVAGKQISHAFLDAVGEKIGATCEVEITYRDWQGKRYQSVRIESCGETVTAAPTIQTPKVAPRVATTTAQVARPAAKNYAPTAQSNPPPSINIDEEMPDFMR